MRDVALRERAREVRWQGFGVLGHGVADRARDFVLAGVGEADVQDGVAVVLGQIHGAVDGLQDVGLDELALAQDADAGAVALQQLAVLGELCELDFEHVHQGVDFVFGALEVLDTEGVDRHDADSGFVADF